MLPVVVAAVLLAGCTGGGRSHPAPDRVTLHWSRTALPGGVAPSLVAPGARGSVLVAVDGDGTGSSPPRLFHVVDGRVRSEPVRATTYYGRRVVWGGVATHGLHTFAYGGRSGGAHGNVRWSAWAGRSGLAEEEQTFETFGGPRAGGLAGIAVTGDGTPVLVGSRVGEQGAGLDVAVWVRQGRRWVRQDSTGTPLAAEDEEQPSTHGILAGAGGLLVLGSVTELGRRPRTVPAVWSAPAPTGPWTRQELPGARSPVAEASAGACGDDGTCLVVGDDGGRLLGWRVLADGAVEGADLPARAVDPGSLTVAGAPGRWTVASTTEGQSRVLVGDADHWRTAAGPPGAMRTCTAVDDVLWAVSVTGGRTELWSAAVP